MQVTKLSEVGTLTITLMNAQFGHLLQLEHSSI